MREHAEDLIYGNLKRAARIKRLAEEDAARRQKQAPPSIVEALARGRTHLEDVRRRQAEARARMEKPTALRVSPRIKGGEKYPAAHGNRLRERIRRLGQMIRTGAGAPLPGKRSEISAHVARLKAITQLGEKLASELHTLKNPPPPNPAKKTRKPRVVAVSKAQAEQAGLI